MLQNRCTIFLYTIHFLQLFNRFEIILKYKLKSIIKCHFSLDILRESPFHQAFQSVCERSVRESSDSLTRVRSWRSSHHLPHCPWQTQLWQYLDFQTVESSHLTISPVHWMLASASWSFLYSTNSLMLFFKKYCEGWGGGGDKWKGSMEDICHTSNNKFFKILC